MALPFRLVIALLPMVWIGTAVSGQDNVSESGSQAAKIEQLTKENEKLRSQIVAMSLEIQELKSGLPSKMTDDGPSASEKDYLSVGTMWKGRFDGRGPQGGDHHGTAEAVVTARTESGFQMRIRGQEGNEFIVTCTGSKNVFMVSEVRHTSSPDKNAALGPKLINSSRVVLNVPKSGLPTLKVSLVAPLGNSGITVTYTLQTES